ncbi:MAG: hypothetical protein IPP51_05275 [Bacteroidetes bacterium]|nr:hypothetical protein [Bacteroidota bacterium]
MKKSVSALCLLFLLFTSTSRAGDFFKQKSSGWFSLGTRNTFSLFNDIENEKNGIGIGGQYRIQLNDKFNTEWFADYLTSKIGDVAQRNDYHIGWSVMYYLGKNVYFDKTFQPYLILGHCFDQTSVFILNNTAEKASRFSMATQAGLGTHINITERLDITLTGQYMIHFGKELNVINTDGVYSVEQEDHTNPGGHLLISVSANFKFCRLWNAKKA